MDENALSVHDFVQEAGEKALSGIPEENTFRPQRVVHYFCRPFRRHPRQRAQGTEMLILVEVYLTSTERQRMREQTRGAGGN